MQIAKFAYNNLSNITISYISFELNFGYHLLMFFEEKKDLRSYLKTADKIIVKLQKILAICRENLYHAQKLYKKTHNKGVQPKTYALCNKFWLYSKYIMTKYN